MGLQTSASHLPLEEVERCPECGHAWNDLGPVHFADCRLFWVEEEREEDMVFIRDGWDHLSHQAA